MYVRESMRKQTGLELGADFFRVASEMHVASVFSRSAFHAGRLLPISCDQA